MEAIPIVYGFMDSIGSKVANTSLAQEKKTTEEAAKMIPQYSNQIYILYIYIYLFTMTKVFSYKTPTNEGCPLQVLVHLYGAFLFKCNLKKQKQTLTFTHHLSREKALLNRTTILNTQRHPHQRPTPTARPRSQCSSRERSASEKHP